MKHEDEVETRFHDNVDLWYIFYSDLRGNVTCVVFINGNRQTPKVGDKPSNCERLCSWIISEPRNTVYLISSLQPRTHFVLYHHYNLIFNHNYLELSNIFPKISLLRPQLICRSWSMHCSRVSSGKSSRIAIGRSRVRFSIWPRARV